MKNHSVHYVTTVNGTTNILHPKKLHEDGYDLTLNEQLCISSLMIFHEDDEIIKVNGTKKRVGGIEVAILDYLRGCIISKMPIKWDAVNALKKITGGDTIEFANYVYHLNSLK